MSEKMNWTEFQKKTREDNPGIAVPEIAAKWKQYKADNLTEEPKEPSNETTEPTEEKFGEEKQIKTTVRNLSDIVMEKLKMMKDMATMEIMLPVDVRMKNRLESIRKISSAYSIKVQKHWKTVAPQIHISNLSGKKISNDECVISFGVFDVDAKGNKKEHKNYSEKKVDGKIIKEHQSSEYRIKFEIVERIRTNKAIIREKTVIDRIYEVN